MASVRQGVLALLLVAAVLTLLWRSSGGGAHGGGGSSGSSSRGGGGGTGGLRAETAAWRAGLRVKVAPQAWTDVAIRREKLADVEAVWAMPAQQQPTRLLLLLHGCNHGAESWFTYGEHRAFVTEAVTRGWAVLALSSVERTHSRCWARGAGGDNVDVVRVGAAVKAFVARDPRLANIPVSAAGASSGGNFVTLLAAARLFRLASVAVYISSGNAAVIQAAGSMWPPTAFVHMPRDTETAQAVAEAVATISRYGSAAVNIPCLPRPLGPLTLHDLLGVSPAASSALYDCAIREYWANATGYLRADGRQSRPVWEPELAHNPAFEDELVGLGDHVNEIFNAHYALHEMTSDHAREVLDWLAQPSTQW